jgi:uncharacterized paraquat-inducible protein A
MSAATQTFMQIVQDTDAGADGTAITPVNTFMRFCSVCMEVMPHYREETYCQCAVCWTKTYRRRKSEQGQALVEMMLLTALVLFVLIYVCKDWPW